MKLSAHAEVGIYESLQVIDSWRVLAKNARINSPERLVQLQLELSLCRWDIICLSETRCQTQDVFLDGGHRLISSNSSNARSPASGVAILLHQRWTGRVARKICLHDRVMAIDVKVSRRTIRIIAVYLPNSWTYDLQYFQEIFDDIERLSMETADKGYALIIAGDFNLSLERGDRGKIMKEFCTQFCLDIANGHTHAEEANTWTFESSIHGLYRLDYILHSLVFRSYDVSANDDLDLGSDHRNVSTSLEILRSQQLWKKRCKSFKGWKSKLNNSREPEIYHGHLQKLFEKLSPTCLHELGEIAVQSVDPGGERFQGPKDVKRPAQSRELKDLILQRKEASSIQTRKDMSKKIQKQVRKEVRLWKTKWAEYLLLKFMNTKYFQKINISQIRSAACPIDSEAFASFLEELFSNEAHLIASDDEKMKIQDIPPFQFEELERVLKGMTNLRGADEDGVVVEMIKYASKSFKITLLSFYNQRLLDDCFDESWHTTILQMLSKD